MPPYPSQSEFPAGAWEAKRGAGRVSSAPPAARRLASRKSRRVMRASRPRSRSVLLNRRSCGMADYTSKFRVSALVRVLSLETFRYKRSPGVGVRKLDKHLHRKWRNVSHPDAFGSRARNGAEKLQRRNSLSGREMILTPRRSGAGVAPL